MIVNNSLNLNQTLFKEADSNTLYINTMVDNIKRTFKLNPSYFQISKIINGKDYKTNNILNLFDTWIVDEHSYKQDNGKKKIIMKPPQDLNRGEIIVVPKWDNQKWLVTKIDQQTVYYNNGLMEYCNYLLPWINNNGDIVNSWIVIKNKSKIQEGIDTAATMISSVIEKVVILPFNEYTEEIKRDQRFLISNSMNVNPSSYKVTNVDNTTETGIITLVLSEQGGEISSDDNLELGIADYKTRIATYSLSIGNKSNLGDLQAGVNNTLQINNKIIKTINSNITELNQNSLPSNLQLQYSSSDETICTVDSNGLCSFLNIGNATISVLLIKTNFDGTKETVAQDNISIVVNSVIADNYTISLNGSSTISLSDSSETYTAKEFNNGVEVSGKTFDFIIDRGNVPTDAFEIKTVTNNSITIRCLRFNRANPYIITINVKDRNNNTITTSKQVRLTS